EDATERPSTRRLGLTARPTVVRPQWPGTHRALHRQQRYLSLLSMQLVTPRRFGEQRLYELPLRFARCRCRQGSTASLAASRTRTGPGSPAGVGSPRSDILRQWQMWLERAAYEAALAERRYQEVDPSQRLVAATLERRWNDALLQLDDLKKQAAEFQRQEARVATAEQKAKVLALAKDLPRLR